MSQSVEHENLLSDLRQTSLRLVEALLFLITDHRDFALISTNRLDCIRALPLRPANRSRIGRREKTGIPERDWVIVPSSHRPEPFHRRESSPWSRCWSPRAPNPNSGSSNPESGSESGGQLHRQSRLDLEDHVFAVMTHCRTHLKDRSTVEDSDHRVDHRNHTGLLTSASSMGA